jgi:hypothetical protein
MSGSADSSVAALHDAQQNARERLERRTELRVTVQSEIADIHTALIDHGNEKMVRDDAVTVKGASAASGTIA